MGIPHYKVYPLRSPQLNGQKIVSIWLLDGCRAPSQGGGSEHQPYNYLLSIDGHTVKFVTIIPMCINRSD